MALDLDNPEIKAEVDALREAAKTEAETAMAEKYAGLEKNHAEVVADRKAASAKAKEAQEQLERYQTAAGGRDIDEIESTFTNIENADYKALLGDKKLDEAYEMRAKAERKEFARQLEEKDKAIRKSDETAAKKEERLLELELYSVATEEFLKAKGRESGIRDLKSRIGADAKRDENGDFFFPGQFGNPRKDSEGNQMVISSYINEHLRVDAAHLFPEVKGSGASGSNGNAAPGTKKRSDFGPGERSAFIREHGQEAYNNLAA